MDEFDKKIERQNKAIGHGLWIIVLSMVTSIFTTLAATGQLETWLQRLR